MKKICLFFVCFFCFIGDLYAQDPIFGEEQTDPLPLDSLIREVGLIPEGLDANVDSLLRSWHVQYFSKVDEYCHDDDANVYFPDSVYKARLEQLQCIVPLAYNGSVRDCIDLYAGRKRGLVRYMLGMADYLFPIIEEILDKHNLPLELKYLAVVESGLNPVALSRAGACGLWQFMLPTGKIYGLEINSLLDERRDAEKATEAACRYFKDMYAIYGDWLLVLAAYNCGPGNVNKAIHRSGGKTDFWTIYPFLPRETRSYVPLYIAATYVMNHYCDHNICPYETSLPLATDTVMINKMLHLQQVSDLLHIDIEQLRALNPQYKRDIIPGNMRPLVLRLPASISYAFVDNEDSVYQHRVEELLADCAAIDPSSGSLSSKKEKITHVVATGETVLTIANHYGVTASDIRKWNGLKSNRVPKGRKLILHVDNGGVSFSTNTAKKHNVQSATANSAPVATQTTAGGSTYVVRSGDSLYTIAKKFPGVSADDLIKANDLTNAAIQPGQVLKIPKR